MDNALETINFDNGVYAEIHHDYDTEQPWSEDDGIKIVILHRRYSDPAEGECGKDAEEVRQWCKDNAREWFIMNLFMYEHSAVALRAGYANPFSCPWDSGQVGIIALKKSEWGKGKGERNAKRAKYAKDAAEYYGRWMNGETYGYILFNEDGEELDSCWGYIGYDEVEEAAKESADYYVKEEGERKAREADEASTAEAVQMMEDRPDLYA